MDFAVVIDAGNDAAALEQAINTELLLLERLGSRLESIRLAIPRLMHNACASAIAEKPDILILVGGSRAARRAGQLAYAHKVPIVFLPGGDSPGWAHSLWGSSSLDEMVAALAQRNPRPVKLSAGAAGGQIFFGEASCGLLPQIRELRQAFRRAESHGETWQAVVRAASLARQLIRPKIRVRLDDTASRCATALLVSLQGVATSTTAAAERGPFFACEVQNQGLLQHWGSLAGAAFDGKRQRGASVDRFACPRLAVDAGPNWLLLDGDPKRVGAPIDFTILRDAIQSFSFAPVSSVASDNSAGQQASVRPLTATVRRQWNLPAYSHVATSENRNCRDLGQTKRV